MELTLAFLWAGLYLGLPMTVLTFAMVWWALHRGIVEPAANVEALAKEIENFGKARKKQKKKDRINPLHHKWFEFGGGFYGLAALYTYLVVEFDEVIGFIANVPGMVLRFDVGVLVNFFIESIQNFIIAITWPIYWTAQTSRGQFWVWLVVAWAGYTLGVRLARTAALKQGIELPESWLQRLFKSSELE